MAVVKPTAGQMTENQFTTLDNVNAVVSVDKLYIGTGSMSGAEITAAIVSTTTLDSFLSGSTIEFGEGQEKQLTIQSTTESVETAHYTKELSRKTAIEMMLAGIAEEKKNELETFSEEGTLLTFIVREHDVNKIVILNGITVSIDWGANDQELAIFTIKSTVKGKTATENRIRFANVPDPS